MESFSTSRITRGSIVFDLNGQIAWKNGVQMHLTTTEYQLLEVFFSHQGVVLTRKELFRSVWGCEFLGESRAIDILISRLRHKIEDEPSKPTIILTKRGRGYVCP